MNIPVLSGTIARRILMNFRAEPEVVQQLLPKPFRPKLHGGHAIVGVCLIRLEHIRPKLLPRFTGISSENAAHRIAIEWDENGTVREGVYIPRRDSNSRLNMLAGGRLFPGEHHAAEFRVQETPEDIDFFMHSLDGAVQVRLKGQVSREWPSGSCFSSLDAASKYFEGGSLGYSANQGGEHLDGLELRTRNWRVELLQASEVQSSFFAGKERFPPGSIEFDHALLMRGIEHEWHSAAPFPIRTATLNG